MHKTIFMLVNTLYVFIMYESIPSLTIPPGDARGFAHSKLPLGSGFCSSFLPGGLPGSVPRGGLKSK